MTEIIVIALAVFIDQIVKLAVIGTMVLGESIPVWQDVFHITYVQNTGAAFSMMEGSMLFFYIITPIAICCFGWYIRKIRQDHKGKIIPKTLRMQIVALSLILGGTIGNFIDRVNYKYVIDMFDFCLINFAVFNVADICLVVGSFGLIILLSIEIIAEIKADKEKQLATETAETENCTDGDL